MHKQELECGEGYRPIECDAAAGVPQRQTGEAIDQHLGRRASLAWANCHSGSDQRHLLTELGDMELAVRRTRRIAPISVLRDYGYYPIRSTA